MKKTKNKNRDAQKKRTSHKAVEPVLRPEGSLWWERFVIVTYFRRCRARGGRVDCPVHSADERFCCLSETARSFSDSYQSTHTRRHTRQDITRHTARTSMYSLTFRIRVTTPPQCGRNGTAHAAAGASMLSPAKGVSLRRHA